MEMLPNDTTMERSLISALCQAPDMMEVAASQLTAADFFDPAIGKLFEVLRASIECGNRPRNVLVLANMTRHLDPQYTPEFWHAFRAYGSVHQIEYYTHAIKSHSTARQLALAAGEIAAEVESIAKQQRTPDGDELLSRHRARLDAIGATAAIKITPLHAAASKAIVEAQKAREPGGPVAAVTGLPALDAAGAIMRASTITVLAARPGCGKSAFALQVATHNAAKNRPVLLVSLEMREEEISLRSMASDTGVSMSAAMDGRTSDADIAKLSESRNSLRSLPINVASGAIDVDRLCATIRLEALRGRCSLAIVDYLQLVTPAKSDSRLPREQQVALMTRRLKNLANEIGVPLLLLCQLNRAADQETPRLSHLRESGAIEQDADNVWFLHRPDSQENDSPMREVKFTAAKLRNGAPFHKTLTYDGPRFFFSEASREMEPQNQTQTKSFADWNQGPANEWNYV